MATTKKAKAAPAAKPVAEAPAERWVYREMPADLTGEARHKQARAFMAAGYELAPAEAAEGLRPGAEMYRMRAAEHEARAAQRAARAAQMPHRRGRA